MEHPKRGRTVFIASEGGEVAWIVVLLGDVDHFIPDFTRHGFINGIVAFPRTLGSHEHATRLVKFLLVSRTQDFRKGQASLEHVCEILAMGACHQLSVPRDQSR